jgi:hypothetical protein
VLKLIIESAGAAGLVTVGAAVCQEERVHEPEEPQSHWLQCWFKVSDYTDAQAAVNIALWLLTPFPHQQPRDLSHVSSSTVAVCQPPTPTRTVMTGARATHNEDNPVESVENYN